MGPVSTKALKLLRCPRPFCTERNGKSNTNLGRRESVREIKCKIFACIKSLSTVQTITELMHLISSLWTIYLPKAKLKNNKINATLDQNVFNPPSYFLNDETNSFGWDPFPASNKSKNFAQLNSLFDKACFIQRWNGYNVHSRVVLHYN